MGELLPVPGMDHPPPRRHLLVVPAQDPDSGTSLQLPPEEEPVLEEIRKLPGLARGRDHTQIAELLAERCSQAVLDFLATTDVGRTSGPTAAADEGGAASEASEWDRRSGWRSAWQRRNGLGGGLGAYHSFSLTLNFFISFVLNYRLDWRDGG